MERVSASCVKSVTLNPWCLPMFQWGAIVHELGHTIGFWHEHQRSDRDQYVTIYPERMSVGSNLRQIEAKDSRNLEEYDYASIMHYWAWVSWLKACNTEKSGLFLDVGRR